MTLAVKMKSLLTAARHWIVAAFDWQRICSSWLEANKGHSMRRTVFIAISACCLLLVDTIVLLVVVNAFCNEGQKERYEEVRLGTVAVTVTFIDWRFPRLGVLVRRLRTLLSTATRGN